MFTIFVVSRNTNKNMKYITTILIYLGLTFLMAFTFNHISPWLGVAVAITTFYLAAKQIENKIK